MRHPKLRLAWHAFTIFLVGVGLCFFAMRSRAPLSMWMVSAEDVEEELARRAAAGDPVQAELLTWSAARPGLTWRCAECESVETTEDFAACDPCALGVPGGLDAFEAEAASPFGSSPRPLPLPSPLWLIGFADHEAAELKASTAVGDGAGVLRAARRFRCLLELSTAPSNLMRGLTGTRLEEQFLRACEAALPALGNADRRALAELFRFDDSADRHARFVSALRGERAFLRRMYGDLVAASASGFEAIVGGNSARPMHGEFLRCLREYDELLASLQHSNFRDVALELTDLYLATSNGGSGELAQISIPSLCQSYEQFVTNVALRRCAQVAAVRVLESVEAAESLAATLADPFDGESLRTRVLEDGTFEVWSVGPGYYLRTPRPPAAATGAPQAVLFRVPALRD